MLITEKSSHKLLKWRNKQRFLCYDHYLFDFGFKSHQITRGFIDFQWFFFCLKYHKIVSRQQLKNLQRATTKRHMLKNEKVKMLCIFGTEEQTCTKI